jgi:DNA-binding CsgD family transcriptional regulator
MADSDRLVAALPAIYEAAADPKRMSTLADEIARAFDSDSAILFLCKDPDPGLEFVRTLSTTANFDDWARTSYGTYFHERDEWFSRGIKKALPAIVLGQELIDDRAFARTEFCADWCEKIGFFRVLGTAFHVDDIVGALGLHRPRRGEQFGEAERRRMRLFIPHLQRAFQLSWRLSRLEEYRHATEQITDRLGWGLALLDENGRILQLNRAAEAMLAPGDGLRVAAGKLVATDGDRAAQLRRLIAEAGGAARGRGLGPGADLSVERKTGLGPLAVSIMPLRTGDPTFAGGNACVAVFMRERGPVSAAALVATIGALTPRQREITALAMQGFSNLAIARRLALSEHTVKDHLKDVFEKLGVRSRAALTAKVIGLAKGSPSANGAADAG